MIEKNKIIDGDRREIWEFKMAFNDFKPKKKVVCSCIEYEHENLEKLCTKWKKSNNRNCLYLSDIELDPHLKLHPHGILFCTCLEGIEKIKDAAKSVCYLM